jgi:hypothetical protein
MGVYTNSIRGKNMINSPLTILDNTGCFFRSESNYLVIGDALAGYAGINTSHHKLKIPYLCKNKDKYELGIGSIDAKSDKIILNREKILSSSDNNQAVNFGDSSGNYLYCFANSLSFRTGLNNLVQAEGSFDVSDWKATYLIDVSKENATATLPPASSARSLVLEFQTSEGQYAASIVDNNFQIITTLSSNSYCKLISTGSSWLELKTNPNTQSFNSLSEPGSFDILNTISSSASGSVQYNNGTSISGSQLYVDSLNQKLLLGNRTENLASIILSTNGNSSNIFNNTRTSSDFIVKGSGDKSFWFLNSGKVGINVPTTAPPESVSTLHIINTACGEGIRLENRNQCSPANLTLYHKPSTVPVNNSIVSTINLSAKNSSNNQIEFVQLRARALSAIANSSSGEFAIAVDRSGSLTEAVLVNPNMTSLISNTNRINISSSGIDLIGDVRMSSIKLAGPVISGQILMSNSNGNLVLTSPNNSSIIDLLDPGVIVFTGVCT